MTLPIDGARSRDVVARWCRLAEQRLEHLTELFETGRWRRYHTETAFLENVQEAKAAVETWRGLLTCGDRVGGAIPQPQPIIVELPREIPGDVLIALESQLFASDDAPSLSDAPDLDEVPLPAIDLDAIQQRYPLLRNAL